MKLSVIIPVYNEEDTILELLDRVAKAPIKVEMEVIVVNDGSSDSTSDKLEGYFSKFSKSGYGIQLKIIHKVNGGKGSAIFTGLNYATGDIVLIQDADLEYYPDDYGRLIEPMLKGYTRVVYGSRFMGRYIPQGMTLKNWVGNMVLNATAWALYGFGSTTDLATGYKVWFRKDIPADALLCKGFEFCPVHFAACYHRGLKIWEVPISFNARWYDAGKKLTTSAGIFELFTLIKARFNKDGPVRGRRKLLETKLGSK